MSKLSYTKINTRYKISFNKADLGELEMLEDGFYHWFPGVSMSNNGCISSWILKDIYEKLEELNKGWNEVMNQYFKDEKNN